MKRIVPAVVVVFVAWSLLDYIIHGVILNSTYQATASLWRPANEMKLWLMYLVTLIYSIVFVYIYAGFFAKKSVGTAVKYGIIFGIGAGISMGYGSYSAMPIPYIMALTWFLGTLVEATVAGLLTGLIIGKQTS